MESESAAKEPRRRLQRLTDVVMEALDTATITDLPAEVIYAGVKTIVEKVEALPAPTVDAVAEIVKVTLEKTGEGLGEAAGAAGEIAEQIVDGLGGLDLNV